MKKRLISILASVAMISAFVVPVNAGYTTDDTNYVGFWSFNKVGENDGSATINTSVKHSGSKSMRFQYNTPLKDNTYMRVINTLKKNTTAGQSYTLTFWAADLTEFKDANLRVMLGWGNYTNINASTWVKGETVDGMTKYTVKHTPDAASNQLAFNFNFNCNQFKMDDVSFVDDSTGDDLVQNGSFEDVIPKAEYAAAKDSTHSIDGITASYTDGAVMGDDCFVGYSNEVAYEGDASLAVRNAKGGTIVLSTGRLGNGWNQLSFVAKGNYDESQIAFRDYKINGTKASDGNGFAKKDMGNGWTKYSLRIWGGSGATFYFRNSGTKMIYIDDLRIINEGTKLDSLEGKGGFNITAEKEYITDLWEILQNGTNHGDAYIYTGEKKNGSYGLRVFYPDDQADNNYIRIVNTLSEKAVVDREYTLKFYSSADFSSYTSNNMTVAVAYNNAQGLKGNNTNLVKGEMNENGLYEYTMKYVAGAADNRLMLTANFNLAQFEIDDISFTDTTTGKNLVQNGNFENTILKSEYDAVKNSTYSAKGITISYTDGAVEGDDCFAKVTDNAYFEGNASLAVRKTGSGTILLNLGQMGNGWNKLSLKVKGVYNEGNIAFRNYKLDGTLHENNGFTKKALDDGWTEYSMRIWGGAGAAIYFRSNAATMLYIDDVKVVSEGSGLDTLNGAGRFNYVTAVTTVDNLAFDGKNVAWEISDDFAWDGIDVFVNDVLTEECDYDAEGCVLDGVKKDDVISVKTYSMDESGNKVYNEAVSVTSTYGAVDFADSVFDVVDAEGNVTTPGITDIQTGKIKVTKAVTNRYAGADYTAVLAVAVYNSSHKLIDVKYASSSVPQNGETTEIYTTVDVADSGYYVKAMLWDSFAGMNALDTADILD